ncbi:hypothetical protein HY489_04150 [Candidatus Woesearchaeota archaeon]|nr:hypothetical protein [Candidatus Woesearchaeota archaeon]
MARLLRPTSYNLTPSSFVLHPTPYYLRPTNYKLRTAKGQVKMFETVGVLVVFFFLLISGSVFYFGAQKSSLQKEKVKASEQQALQVVLKALYLPELDCSFLKAQRENCIDKLKLRHVAALMRNESVFSNYYPEFGYATIRVQELYPAGESVDVYVRKAEEYSSILVTQSPILLYDPVRETYGFGVIEVAAYV